MPFRNLLAGVGVVLLFGLGVAAAPAEPSGETATSETTTSTTAAPTTSDTATTAPTTTVTTAATTVAPTTTAPAAQTTAPTTARSAVTVSASTAGSGGAASATQERSLAQGCPVAAAALLLPGRVPLLLGPVAAAPVDAAGLSALRYPADGSIVSGSEVLLAESSCEAGGPPRAQAQLRSLSLFAGAVTARRVTLRAGSRSTADVVGLEADGKRAGTAAGRVGLGSWGYVVSRPRTALPLTGGGAVLSALAVHLVRAHAGLPAGAVLLVSLVGVPDQALVPAARTATGQGGAGRQRGRAKVSRPLRVTPPLGEPRYVFPVAGPSDYVDTYGAFRSDVNGNWHHGDDIFAPLGTPVVAVASGTINHVGWEKLGGWRLWVRDDAGDEFYYAHLSGYAPSDLRSDKVKAGQVIGFVGNTGDAFTTSPHLHFEIHPRSLLHLGYGGAVDPTTYLDHWTHLEHVTAPVPVYGRMPRQPQLRREARYVFRELLAARHLARRRVDLGPPPHVLIPVGANGPPPVQPTRQAAAPLPSRRAGAGPVISPLTLALFATVLAFTLVTAALTARRRVRRAPAPGSDADSPPAEPPSA